jgi:hypothetical protein
MEQKRGNRSLLWRFVRKGLNVSLAPFILLSSPSLEARETDSDSIPLVVLHSYWNECVCGCPEYQLSIYADGNVVFDGRRGTLVQGIHYKRVSENKVDRIKSLIGRLDQSGDSVERMRFTRYLLTIGRKVLPVIDAQSSQVVAEIEDEFIDPQWVPPKSKHDCLMTY